MTTATQGVAVPVDASLGEIFVTTDGGQTWTAVADLRLTPPGAMTRGLNLERYDPECYVPERYVPGC